jgi:hypothetical protein
MSRLEPARAAHQIGMRQRAAALLALGFAAVACGGGERLSYPEFQRTANRICATYQQRLGGAGLPDSPRSLARVARHAYALGRREREALEALRPPKQAADRYARMLDRLERSDELLPPLWRAAAKGKDARVRSLATAGRDLVRLASADAKALGIPDCRRG